VSNGITEKVVEPETVIAPAIVIELELNRVLVFEKTTFPAPAFEKVPELFIPP
jgi:hypothetical protein